MSKNCSRRVFLKGVAGTAAAAGLGGFGCFSARPTEPTDLLRSVEGSCLLLANVHVVDVENGLLQSDSSVLVRDGRIAAIGKQDTPFDRPMQTFDCRGAYLIPGLINAHCHINSPSVTTIKTADLKIFREQITRNYSDAICWGVTTVRDMGSIPSIMRSDREMIEQGRLLGPRILTPFSNISVPGGYPDFLKELGPFMRMMLGTPVYRTSTPAQAADCVKRVRDQGADVIKIAFDHQSVVYGKGSLEVLTDAQLEAILNEAEKAGLPVGAHHLFSQGLDRGLQFSVHSLEHLPGDAELTDAQLKRIIDAKMPIVPTLTVGISMAFKSEDDPLNDNPFLNEILAWKREVQYAEMPEHCSTEIHAKLQEVDRFYRDEEYRLKENKDINAYNTRLTTRGICTWEKNIRKLIEADAILGVGNDSGVPFIFPGMIHLEMEHLVRFGMSPAQALRAATLVNARICRVDADCGTITPGKRADLALLAGNPLEDIKYAGQVRAVFKKGVLVSKADDFPVPS